MFVHCRSVRLSESSLEIVGRAIDSSAKASHTSPAAVHSPARAHQRPGVPLEASITGNAITREWMSLGCP